MKSEFLNYSKALKAADDAYQKYIQDVEACKRKRRMLEIFVYTPIRIVIFPIALLVRVYRWVYHYDD